MRAIRTPLERQRKPRRGRMPRPRAPRAIERRFGKAIVVLLAPLRSIVRGIVVPELSGIVALGPHMRDHADADFGGKIKQVIDRARVAYAERVPDTKIARTAGEAEEATSDEQRAQWREQAQSAAGVDPLRGEPWLADVLRDQTRQNVELIKIIPDVYFDRIEQTIRAGVLAGKRHEAVAQELQDDFLSEDADEWAKLESRAALIARDQTMKLFGTLARVRQEDLGIKSYLWRTAMDERVRPEHAAREGAQFDWSAAPEDGHPGMPINCRCVAEPVFE